MTIKMLFYDYREAEKSFFEQNKLDNFDIKFFKESLNSETVKNLSQEEKDNVSVISVFVDSVVNADVIKEFKNLRIVSTRSTGYNHICTQTCMGKNISLINVENYGERSVAQYIIGLMIALTRNLVAATQHIKNDALTSCTDYIGRDLSELTIGVVGTGAIGAAVCKIANAIGMKILAYDLMPKKELERLYSIKYVEIDELLRSSDVISLHVPFTGENRNMISKKEFDIMKKGAYLINAARGELVNLKDLLEALSVGRLAGAALDVVLCEISTFHCSDVNIDKSKLTPECVWELEIIDKLSKMNNVIITPHVAYQTQEAVDYILKITFDGIMDCIKGGSSYKVV